MVDRKDVASWLEGPNAQRPDADTDYPGRRLGMPQRGPGSVGRFGRRLVAIIIDWTLCQLIAYAWLGVRLGEGSSGSWWPLVIFGVENLLLLSTLGSTFGQRLLGGEGRRRIRDLGLEPDLLHRLHDRARSDAVLRVPFELALAAAVWRVDRASNYAGDNAPPALWPGPIQSGRISPSALRHRPRVLHPSACR